MEGFFLIGFIIVIALDSRLFKKRDANLFKKTFQMPLAWKNLILCILFFMFFGGLKDERILFLTVFLFLLPIYILRRDYLTRKLQIGELKEDKSVVWASDALGVVVHWFFSVIVLNVFLENIFLFSREPDKELIQILLLAFLSFGLLLVFIYKACQKFSSQGFWANVGFRSKSAFIPTILIPSLLGILFAFISVSLILTRIIQPETPLGNILEKVQSPFLLFIFIFLALMIAPLVEEIIFRGYFFEVLKRYQGKYGAIIIISLVFGLLHAAQYWGDWLAIGMIVLLGFVLTVLRSWTEDTRASVVAHYAYNISVIIIPIIFSLSPQAAKVLDSLH